MRPSIKWGSNILVPRLSFSLESLNTILLEQILVKDGNYFLLPSVFPSDLQISGQQPWEGHQSRFSPKRIQGQFFSGSSFSFWHFYWNLILFGKVDFFSPQSTISWYGFWSLGGRFHASNERFHQLSLIQAGVFMLVLCSLLKWVLLGICLFWAERLCWPLIVLSFWDLLELVVVLFVC